MGRMKDLHIDLMNKLVNDTELPIWLIELYGYPVEMVEGIESPSILDSDLNTTELSHLLDYENFKESGQGQDYCAYFGNWEDAYDQYLYDLGYYQSATPDMI